MNGILLFVVIFAALQCVLPCDVYEYGVSDEDKEFIVNKHNEVRKRISHGELSDQPRGVNLKKMVWDDYIAGQAQNIANTCIYKHQRVSDSRWQVGQNLYIQPTLEVEKGTDWDAAVEYWFAEHVNYTYSTSYTFDKNTGHYTQLVWAETTHVGCGYTYYPDGSLYQKFYVCNYAPAGNMPGGLIYEEGDHGCEELC